MYRIYQNFIDSLAESTDATSLRESMADTIRALDLSCFAYLWMPDQRSASPQLISTYPVAWTSHYLENHYERFDPVVVQAIQDAEPFEWGVSSSMIMRSHMQRQLFEEATKFGICHGFTVPIHDSRGPIAAVTFATDQSNRQGAKGRQDLRRSDRIKCPAQRRALIGPVSSDLGVPWRLGG